MGAKKSKTTTQHLLSYELIGVVVNAVGLTGLLSVYEYWQKDKTTLVGFFSVCVFIALFVVLLTRRSISTEKLPSIAESKSFYPFLHQIPDADLRQDPRIVSRLGEGRRIGTEALKCADRHLVIAGNSGSGKSTILRTHMGDVLSPTPIWVFSEYQDIEREFLHRIVETLPDHVDALGVHASIRQVLDALDRCTSGDSAACSEFKGKFSLLISALAKTISPTGWMMVAFDQAERLLATRRAESDAIAACRAWCRHAFFEELRLCPSVVTMFAVRGDDAVECMAYLNAWHSEKGMGSLGDTISCLTITGLSLEQGDDIYNRLFAKFQKSYKRLNFDRLARALSLRDHQRANTFVLQLAGYMIEGFHGSDPEIRRFAEKGAESPDIVFRKFFEVLGSEYAAQTQDKNSRSVLDVVLLTCATYNSRRGLPISAKRIAEISHTPEASVIHAVEFLVDKGVLYPSSDDGDGVVRLVHDRLVDYVLASDLLRVRRDHRAAIGSLTDPVFDNVSMTLPRLVPKISEISNIRSITLPQISILLMILFCAGRLFFPEEYFGFLAPINAFMDGMLPGVVQPYGFASQAYVPIFITQGLWVIFMYRLDRGYFSYVFASGWPFMRRFSRWISPVGGIFGCLLMFCPALFIVPIIIGGAGLAFIYWRHATSGELFGVAKENSLELSGKTAFNMLLSLGMTVVLYLLLVRLAVGEPLWVSLLIIWFFCSAFTWYWFMMMGRQGSQAGWSTLLSIFEGGHYRRPTPNIVE